MQIVWQSFPFFLLIVCRITAFFAVAPLFSTRGVPNHFKIGLAFFVSLLAFASLGPQNPIEFDMFYLLHVVREIVVGLLMGFTVYLFFTVFQIAGAFIDFMIGFAVVNVIDPLTGTQGPIFGNFKYILALVLFLSFNGHLYLLDALLNSYQWIPLHHDLFVRIYEGEVSNFLWKTFSEIFVLAFQVAAPLAAAMFLVDVALGFLSRTSPQFNVFIVGLPVKILVGFLILGFLTTSFADVYSFVFEKMFEALRDFLGLMRAS